MSAVAGPTPQAPTASPYADVEKAARFTADLQPEFEDLPEVDGQVRPAATRPPLSDELIGSTESLISNRFDGLIEPRRAGIQDTDDELETGFRSVSTGGTACQAHAGPPCPSIVSFTPAKPEVDGARDR